MDQVGDVHLQRRQHVAVVEMRRPPYNFFDPRLIADLASVFEYLDQQDWCRCLVLAAEGKAFSAGADFQADSGGALFQRDSEGGAEGLYANALRLFRTAKPIVAAVQGPAVGGGLGLSLVADFRVICERTRFSANFVQLGVHAGFGISHVLPRIIGQQKASLMLLSGRRVGPEEALASGLADVMSSVDEIREAAIALAAEIASAAPLAVESTRATLRRGMVEAIETQLQHEYAEQMRLAASEDHQEGLLAVSERRAGDFKRR